MAEVGIVCGMVSEMRTLGAWATDPRVTVGVSGARPDQTEEIAQRMVSEAGVRLLVSWGLAGGLAPEAKTGVLCVPGRVLGPRGQEFQLAAQVLGQEGSAVLAGSDEVVCTTGAKRDLLARTGAMMVDMETHRVAKVADARRVPCLAVRAVSDASDTALPELATDALGADGKVRLGRVLLGLARRPWQLGSLLLAGRDSKAAHATLSANADQIFEALFNGGSFRSDL